MPFRIARGVVLAFLLLIGFFLVDHLPSLWNEISPPADLTTIDDFREWRADKTSAEGTYENGGKTYTVMLGDSGAFLASGPAAYVFDPDGTFVDWARDMGDVYTEKHGFNLTSGNVKLPKTSKP
jgi:hypothetical protein